MLATKLKNNEQPIKTTCPYCGVGCGIEVSGGQDNYNVRGDPRHPANFGKLCIKGKNIAQTLSNDNRLELPTINGQPQAWTRTLDYIASKLNKTIEQHGKDAVAFYVSGQLLTEDYYVANKLMKGFIGSGNIDTNSRLCMSSAVVAHKRAFGEDIVAPSYSDITKADLIVITGSNLAWCHPIIYQRIREEKQRRPQLKVVVIDPRVTASTELADLHLPIKAGGDLILFNGLLNYLAQQKLVDLMVDGISAAVASANQDSKKLAEIGLSSELITQFYQLFATSDKVVTLFSQGINQSQQGADQGSAIINCHLASGKIGRVGCGPFSITGQPNAMGGREVGALANTLASHIEFDDLAMHQPLADFWQTTNLATEPGLKAVELFDAINEGKIKAIWIIATNPLVSMPDNQKIKQALQKCPLVIVSDCVASNDTIEFADIVLPAQGWGEKSGSVTNSERRISRQRSFLTPFGQAKPDWWIISEVAKRMGFAKQFSYQSARDIFAEHARLSGLNNHGTRAFDISAFGDLTLEQYQHWIPVQWPQPSGVPITVSDQSLFGDNNYYHPNNRPQMFAVTSIDRVVAKGSFILNTGRNRDQWHTQTRTGKSALLTNHLPEPELAIHPMDASKLSLSDQTLVSVHNHYGSMLVRIKVTNAQRFGELFMPIHWSFANSNQGCVSQLTAPTVDRDSGQPAFKHNRVNLTPWQANSNALLVVNHKLALDLCRYQVEQVIDGGYCYYLASNEQPARLFERLKSLALAPEHSTVFDASDPKKQYYRNSYFSGDQARAAVLVASSKADLPDGWVSQFYQGQGNKQQAISNNSTALKQQKTFCQCLNIPYSEITEAVAQGKLSLDQIREKTGAGNGCGSCIGDISLALSANQ